MGGWTRNLGATALLPALAMLPVSALAQDATDFGSLDLFYLPAANLESQPPLPAAPFNEDARGFGGKVISWLSDSVMYNGEYQRVRLLTSAEDQDQWRLGLGWAAASTSGLFAEYHRTDLTGARAEGYAVRLRLAGYASDAVHLYGDAGYVRLNAAPEDYDGPEFTLGVGVDVGYGWGLFGDYRITDLEGRRTETELDFWQVRTGVRLLFDC